MQHGCCSEAALKSSGKYRMNGKDYVVAVFIGGGGGRGAGAGGVGGRGRRQAGRETGQDIVRGGVAEKILVTELLDCHLALTTGMQKETERESNPPLPPHISSSAARHSRHASSCGCGLLYLHTSAYVRIRHTSAYVSIRC
jgi:hypothetical protein